MSKENVYLLQIAFQLTMFSTKMDKIAPHCLFVHNDRRNVSLTEATGGMQSKYNSSKSRIARAYARTPVFGESLNSCDLLTSFLPKSGYISSRSHLV